MGGGRAEPAQGRRAPVGLAGRRAASGGHVGSRRSPLSAERSHLMFPVYLKEDGFEEPDDPIYYLVSRDGLFQVKRNPLFHARTRIRGLSWLMPEQEAARLQLPPVPATLLGEVVAFFQEVFRAHRAE